MERLQATKLLLKVIEQKKSLSQLRREINQLPSENRPLVQELCFGVTRWFFQLQFIVRKLIKKPLKQKDNDLYILLLLGVYQILFTRIPTHAAISETVNAARLLNKEWATKLINAVLRNFIRQQTEIIEAVKDDEEAFYAHPKWLISKIKKSWPSWKVILETNNQHPPQCLRVNQQRISREDYLTLLRAQQIEAEIISWTESGIMLNQAVNVQQLPRFNEGYVSIQDGAAQLAAELVDPQKNERILDACAAPGGKTCHILELEPKIKTLVALDNDPYRLEKVTENLQRLHFSAAIVCHDVTNLSWWDGTLFDRVLLDVPCSATGVIQRHPDIKLLRTANDIPQLAKIQYQALKTAWQTLKSNGFLIYVTCSIFPEENEQVIEKFLQSHADCHEVIIEAQWGIKSSVGRQILPGMHKGMDGFYFAKLQKIIPSNAQQAHRI